MRKVYLLEDEDYMIKQMFSQLEDFSDCKGPGAKVATLTDQEYQLFEELQAVWKKFNSYLYELYERGSEFQ